MRTQIATAGDTVVAAEDQDQELEALCERQRSAGARLEALKAEMKSAEAECRAAAWAIDGYRSRKAARR